VQQVTLHVVPRAARALRGFNAAAPVASPAMLAGVVAALGPAAQGLDAVGLVAALCAPKTLESAAYRAHPAALPDIVLASGASGVSGAGRAHMCARAYLAQGSADKAADWYLRAAAALLVDGANDAAAARMVHEDTQIDVKALAHDPPRFAATYLCRGAEQIHAEANVCPPLAMHCDTLFA
jgi:hypothetical protein